jgi:hypothetical protein
MPVQRKTEPASEDAVLAVLRANERGMAWSSIAAKIRGVERDRVTMPEVRGVRDACKALQEKGLVERRNVGVYRASKVAAMREP